MLPESRLGLDPRVGRVSTLSSQPDQIRHFRGKTGHFPLGYPIIIHLQTPTAVDKTTDMYIEVLYNFSGEHREGDHRMVSGSILDFKSLFDLSSYYKLVRLHPHPGNQNVSTYINVNRYCRGRTYVFGYLGHT